MKICLVMIVKNEGHVLRRALESVSGINELEYALIVDTGSAQSQFEDMADITADVFVPDNVHYVFHQKPWVNFGHNRTDALRLAREQFPDADYLFMLDADDYVIKHEPFNIDTDAASVMVVSGTEYPRLQLFKADKPWVYRGVVHEFPEMVGGDEHATTCHVPMIVRSTREGARSRNHWKYAEDGNRLVDAINDPTTDPDLISRYQFYAAQSYRDAGDAKSAEHWYRERAHNEDGYDEERYVSLVERAKLLENLPSTYLLIEALCREAQSICPGRREAVIVGARALRTAGLYSRAIQMLQEHPADSVAVPRGLFIEPSCYQWRWNDELALSWHYYGNYEAAMFHGLRALALYPDKNPDITRLVNNLGFTADKL